ncbi:phage holin family protein [Actinomycetospora callitridis]|jgi:Putative Actinobacterial Holin-X, holin superfamily III|uniref:phage holin family protein n=1 Tax=Actinomycetospora callitridis TaxID=913944 RepID=UPI0023668098|nr:phage holin family protein [Actinomycetospora callitridis]MDD7920377.1 phage holin family protein [Actinomycetospora callitridis]
MTEQQQSPQAGIAGALTDLSEQTRILVRGEIGAAQRETWGKLKATAPALGLLGGAGVLGLAASASAYRASLRLLERWLPPSGAALVATAVYGSGAAAVGAIGLQQLRTLPMPFPAETMAETGALVEETAAEVRRGAGGASEGLAGRSEGLMPSDLPRP